MCVYIFDVLIYEPFRVSSLQYPRSRSASVCGCPWRECEPVSIDVMNYFRENTKNHTKYQGKKAVLTQIILLVTDSVICQGLGAKLREYEF